MLFPCDFFNQEIIKHKFLLITQPNKKKFFSLVPWFLGLFLWLFEALIQKMTLDRPH